jgi:hypothetical protein
MQLAFTRIRHMSAQRTLRSGMTGPADEPVCLAVHEHAAVEVVPRLAW